MIVVVGPLDYSSHRTPPGYECACGARGCKLWRDYMVGAPLLLFCCECAGAQQKHDVSAIDERGRSPSVGGWYGSIGSLVPAVPTIECDTFWGDTSVPQDGVDWWWRLPTKRSLKADPHRLSAALAAERALLIQEIDLGFAEIEQEVARAFAAHAAGNASEARVLLNQALDIEHDVTGDCKILGPLAEEWGVDYERDRSPETP